MRKYAVLSKLLKKKHCYTDDVILFRKNKDIYGNYSKVQIPKISNILLC